MVSIEKLLSGYSYAEIRINRGINTNIKIADDEVKVSSGSYEGMSARVLENGSWGFASSNNMNDAGELLKKARKIALLEKGRISINKMPGRSINIKNRMTVANPENEVSELMDAMKSISGKNIIARLISCNDVVIKKRFINSEGTDITQDVPYTYLSCSAVAKANGVIQKGYETDASRKGFKKINLYDTAKTAGEKAEMMLNAKLPPKGRFTVILDPEMTGVFVHEAIGHAVEADSVVERESILAKKRGKRIGSEIVTIYDDPTSDYFGSYGFDDEGMKAKKVMIIEDGVLKNYINSRETAKKLDDEPNGHARASSFDAVPVVRMSNTFMKPGKQSMNDVFDVKEAIYMKGMTGGSVDTFSGGFMFKAEEAYMIKNGEKQTLLRDATLSGNILKTMKNVCAVGKDFGTSPGICGKMGQRVPVSDGGPHIRVNNMMVG